jgi:hypothetical protein
VRCEEEEEKLVEGRRREEREGRWTHPDSLVGETTARNPPLRLHNALDQVPTLRAHRNTHRVLSVSNIKSLLLHLLDNLNPRMEPLQSLKLRSSVSVERSVVVEDVDEVEFVTLTDFVVVRVVGGGHLDRSSTERHVDGDRVGDDGEAAVEEGVESELAVEVL